jgi:hypothetical protein
MDTEFITIQVSAPKYWGYKYKVPRVYALNVSKEVLIQELKIHMKNFFNANNLQELKEGIDTLNLHFDQDILPNHNVIYACCHNSN